MPISKVPDSTLGGRSRSPPADSVALQPKKRPLRLYLVRYSHAQWELPRREAPDGRPSKRLQSGLHPDSVRPHAHPAALPPGCVRPEQ